MRRTLTIAALLACSPVGIAAADVGRGDRAAEIDLPKLDGGRLRLSSLRGKVVVVDFWASWCGPCREELPALDKLRTAYGDRVAFVAVNLDSDRTNAAKMARAVGGSLQVVLDPEKVAAARYEPPKMPTNYVIDRAGVVRYVNAGFSGAGDVARLRRQIDELVTK